MHLNNTRNKKQKPLISVIVPIYRIDNYLGLCIESIINQSYQHIEIILVDDGSDDRCPELCDLYAEKDVRIKVIHKKNGGLVSARKAGLRESNGLYITYVDGDDWIGPGFIESLYNSLVSADADIVCAGFTRDLFSQSARFLNDYPAGIYEGERLFDLQNHMLSYGDFYRPGITTYVWNKMFRREILCDVQFSVDNRITIGEDAAVTYPALLKSRKVIVSENVSYHYRQREDSMLKQNSSYLREAEKLGYLYDYLMKWAQATERSDSIVSQVEDYILANAIMRSGGHLPNDGYSIFNDVYYGRRVVIYSAGTFGQQLVHRFRETDHCHIVAWLDDDFWEYRRCCLNVDPVDSITQMDFDYILIAKIDSHVAESVTDRLLNLGVNRNQILTVKVPEKKSRLINSFMDIKALQEAEVRKKEGKQSHA